MANVIDSLVHELLHDIRELTSQHFIYEDPWHGFVPYDAAPTEYQLGPPLPFAELGYRDKADVLESFIRWEHYDENGLDSRDQRAIRDNVLDGKPSHRLLEGTSCLDPALRAERREELVRETFELSREIGYAHFRTENFNRPDPVLVRLNPEEREALLAEWWDAARDRMYASYEDQVAGLSNEQLARNRAAYEAALADNAHAAKGNKPYPATSEDRDAKNDTAATLSAELFAPTPSMSTPKEPRTSDGTSNLSAELFSEAAPQPEPTHQRHHKR